MDRGEHIKDFLSSQNLSQSWLCHVITACSNEPIRSDVLSRILTNKYIGAKRERVLEMATDICKDYEAFIGEVKKKHPPKSFLSN